MVVNAARPLDGDYKSPTSEWARKLERVLEETTRSLLGETRDKLSPLEGKGDRIKEIQELTSLLKFATISMADTMYQLAI